MQTNLCQRYSKVYKYILITKVDSRESGMVIDHLLLKLYLLIALNNNFLIVLGVLSKNDLLNDSSGSKT